MGVFFSPKPKLSAGKFRGRKAAAYSGQAPTTIDTQLAVREEVNSARNAGRDFQSPPTPTQTQWEAKSGQGKKSQNTFNRAVRERKAAAHSGQAPTTLC